MLLYSKLRKKYEDGEIKDGTILHDILDNLIVTTEDLKECEEMIKRDEKENVPPEGLKISSLCLVIEKSLKADQTELLEIDNLIQIYKAFLKKLELYLGYRSSDIAINSKIKLIDTGETFDFRYQ